VKKLNTWVQMASPRTKRIEGAAKLIPSSNSRVRFVTPPGLNYGWPSKEALKNNLCNMKKNILLRKSRLVGYWRWSQI